jgi:hypothetical protein
VSAPVLALVGEYGQEELEQLDRQRGRGGEEEVEEEVEEVLAAEEEEEEEGEGALVLGIRVRDPRFARATF